MKSRRDREIMESWYEKYGAYLFRNAYIFFSRDKETAEEVLQETFRVVSEKRHLERVSFPRKWLSEIMKNEIGNYLKRRRNDQALMEKLASVPEEDRLSENEIDLMISYQGLIPDRDLRLVLLIAVEHRTHKEAAVIMGCTEEACRKRYQRAIRKLREKLAEKK